MKKEKSQRQLQVGEEVKRLMAKIFLHEEILTSDKITITITEADVSADLKNIKFYIDIFAEPEDKKEILSQLNRATPFFRKKLAAKISLRTTPQISFKIDDLSDRIKNIESLIHIESSKNRPNK